MLISEIIRDITIALVVLFVGAVIAEAKYSPKNFNWKRAIFWWFLMTFLFSLTRIFCESYF